MSAPSSRPASGLQQPVVAPPLNGRVNSYSASWRKPAPQRLVLRHLTHQGTTPTAEPIDAIPLKEGVAALMRSNHELLPIGKNINQIAKSLNAMQGGFRNADTQNLQVFAQAVREHVEQAARVVATVRALVTPHKAPQKDKP
jgi:Bacterial mobilisation protein (MobC)